MFILPINSYVEILTLSTMVLGGGDLGRWLGHEGGALMNRISVLTKEMPGSSLALPTVRLQCYQLSPGHERVLTST